MELWSSVEKDKAAARQRALDLRDRVRRHAVQLGSRSNKYVATD